MIKLCNAYGTAFVSQLKCACIPNADISNGEEFSAYTNGSTEILANTTPVYTTPHCLFTPLPTYSDLWPPKSFNNHLVSSLTYTGAAPSDVSAIAFSICISYRGVST